MKAVDIIGTVVNGLWDGPDGTTVEKLAGDASTREYYRLKKGGEGYVLCVDGAIEAAEARDFLRLHEILVRHGVRVPGLYRHDVEAGYFLQEDLGDTTFLKSITRISSLEEEFEWYKAAVDLLLGFRSIDAGRYGQEAFVKRSLSRQRLMDEVGTTCGYFLRDFLGRREEETARLEEAFDGLCRLLGDGQKVVTHRDFHSRNIMVKDGDCVAIDFQDTMMGVAQYDLVSLLEDCYYKVSEGNKEKLKRYYWEAAGGEGDFDDFCYLYDLVLVQRLFKAIGSFGYIFKTKNDMRYLPYIGFAFENIRETLLKYDHFKGLREALNSLYYGS